MPDAGTLTVFAATAVVLVAIPGPNLIYIVTRSVSQGRRAGVASALGVETGTFLHTAAAAAGLSAVVASSAIAFAAVRYAGAAYLVYLGIRALTAGGGGDDAERAEPQTSFAASWQQGVLVQVLNPKVIVFFLAFLPQFVDTARGAVGLQVLVLGAIVAAIGLVVDCLYAVAAAHAGGALAGHPRPVRVVSGLVYLALGVGAAVLG